MVAPSPGNEENRALPFFLFLSLNRFPVIIDISVFADDPNNPDYTSISKYCISNYFNREIKTYDPSKSRSLVYS